MPTQFRTVEEYIASLPKERQEAILAVRDVVLKNLPEGIEEGIQYGMIGYFVPHSIYPAGYHCKPSEPLPFAHIASQKNHMAVYLMCIYGDADHVRWFQTAWKKTGKRLDMGKSCVRFKKLDDVALDVLGKALKKVTLKKYIKHYETALQSGGKRTAPKKTAPKKTAPKKTAPKKTAPKKTAPKKTAAKKK